MVVAFAGAPVLATPWWPFLREAESCAVECSSRFCRDHAIDWPAAYRRRFGNPPLGQRFQLWSVVDRLAWKRQYIQAAFLRLVPRERGLGIRLGASARSLDMAPDLGGTIRNVQVQAPQTN